MKYNNTNPFCHLGLHQNFQINSATISKNTRKVRNVKLIAINIHNRLSVMFDIIVYISHFINIIVSLGIISFCKHNNLYIHSERIKILASHRNNLFYVFILCIETESPDFRKKCQLQEMSYCLKRIRCGVMSHPSILTSN